MLQVYGCDDPRSAPGAVRLLATVAMVSFESVLCVYSEMRIETGKCFGSGDDICGKARTVGGVPKLIAPLDRSEVFELVPIFRSKKDEKEKHPLIYRSPLEIPYFIFSAPNPKRCFRQ